MLDEPSWILHKERPKAIVYAIIELTGSDDIDTIIKTLRRVSNNNSWIGKISFYLSKNKEEVTKIIESIKIGEKPNESFVTEVMNLLNHL
ncbi:MAG: hypothetical protein F7B11_03375 [Caldisphaeraceae archaeon]|nr:hypothetical protein [Caldisphaeraceae archaeon]